ncbi:hexosaminidase D-like [Lycorma delicatula]|uniref:hexosaminidase D-like n=1 Tax=Lycorma delicatula TaxID=130591 RepID=UPI003F50E3E4
MDAAYGPNRLIHLDFKGCPIKVNYLEKLFPLFKEWGATGLLIEWEDTFPYSGNLTVIGSNNTLCNAYSEKDIEKIIGLANENGLLVVPLIQTFGHFEFVLKHDQWKNLREINNYPSSLCPSNPDSLNLVISMLDQVINMMPSIRYIHIGADEVWHMGYCEKCNPIPKEKLFLNHVLAVLKYLKQNHPNLQPIMWDDMMRVINLDILKEFGIGDFVQPMIWHYQPAESFCIPEELWIKYSEIFKSVWFASAFKGATGSCQVLPVIRHHASNHQSWLATVEKHGCHFQNVQGIALTGWSRYDHYATLCELLPVAIPSLAVCLHVWNNKGFDETVVKCVANALGYPEDCFSFAPYPRPQPIAPELSYPGWKISVGIEWLENLRFKHKNIIESDQVATWLNSWQIKNNFTNPMQIESLLRAFNDLNLEWDSLENYLRHYLPEVFYDTTIKEWIGTLIEPLRINLNAISEDAQSQIKKYS